MNVLSLFDGMSGGRLALERAGVEVSNYFASEIDRPAIKVTMSNYPDTIQLGDINNYKSWDLPKIDFVIAGSPCQDLTRIKGKEAEGLHGEKSKLFFRFVEVLHKYKPDYLLLENVVMNKESEDTITAILGVDPVEINSSHFSAQDRPRLYWTNIEFDKELPINNTVFSDVMENEVDSIHWLDDEFEKFYGLENRLVGTLKRFNKDGKRRYMDTSSRVYNPNYKMACLTAVSGGGQHKKVFHNGKPRRLTTIEYERLQRVPDNYTAVAAMGQRYKMLGNGFTVDAVAHILKGLK
jgi:DNA-cytosine methyltransferase